MNSDGPDETAQIVPSWLAHLYDVVVFYFFVAHTG